MPLMHFIVIEGHKMNRKLQEQKKLNIDDKKMLCTGNSISVEAHLKCESCYMNLHADIFKLIISCVLHAGKHLRELSIDCFCILFISFICFINIINLLLL